MVMPHPLTDCYKQLVSSQLYNESYFAVGHSNTVTSCTISSRGTELCSSSMDKTAKVWDIRMLQALLFLKYVF